MRERPQPEPEAVQPQNTIDKYQSEQFRVGEIVVMIGVSSLYRIEKMLPDQNAAELHELGEDGAPTGMRVVADIETITRQFA
ncbi:MAG: hypothetical protein A3B30_00665 [Candidatus Komeilibacteria bacterium RIFCSPLOWO2_01_FULL_52_15]|uniref:Uncharacterized protein n=2 Tax=Candidatus Komeiliibacteriota TaxID=1817908 RepID=A0A1G2BQ25_9BACT|nr:MAG: hypothetical protein A2677_03105 [Candidatus Komeilibacteria bacterium RIFCSPHIGHO2_01_FULL_52_14]OGY91213.1 MAG: hypothetical protein A3B30_00665 [Candidatus Komeilibacteria bacterium RIFCSPLOWO2_01_FULL_52_15]